ncbi:hypothetical protein [Amycolatopsis eburnea]|uniref:Helix-hairpin-helix domain-containing protein n=1 Tax=Amycolatopsis eburnea TaxID=2267691 RepID=A0A427TFV7_9PSEU|nr:hypothetical protein [Amycolatopsis eburnea]RSD21975.1 hypothetical protein EIY87_09160 [Amycolatopsis eburnea]
MTELKALHAHGLTHHQTGPLRDAGHDTVERVAYLVDAHRAAPAVQSALSRVTGLGPRRVEMVCDAVDSWRAGAGS